ncbi:hypothetical protein [uncultured Shewanella sp.]|uniref:hypothetical protein n=1 Tax=uncultured Shewanella sp. TaxID=173975 RepID=UPI002632CDE9|nr:hypothetical protein [uncultured Shewanella sp.]
MIKYCSSLFFLLTLLSGCTARPELPSSIATHSINSDYALIVGSLSRANGLLSFDSWSLSFRSLKTPIPYNNIIRGKVDKNVPFGKYDFDFKEQKNSGNIFAYLVPAGEYEIYQTNMTNTYGYSFTSWQSKEPFSLKIHANAGQITYIGEYAIQPVYEGKNLFGVPLMALGYWIVNDKSTRDIAMLAHRYPNLNWNNINKNIIREANTPLFIRQDIH